MVKATKLSVAQRKAIENRVNKVPTFFTPQRTIGALKRLGVFEFYTVRQYWNLKTFEFEYKPTFEGQTATTILSGTRLTGLGFQLATELGYLTEYEEYAAEY